MKIPFTKAHGARNDFLLTWRETVAKPTPEIARAICERHTGVGADGWMLVERGRGQCDAAIQLFNSDGSEAEISGNGTRCAAALLVEHGCTGERHPDPHRRRPQASAPDRAGGAALHLRNEHGTGRGPGAALQPATRRRTARCDAGLGGQSAMRGAGGRFRFRLAEDGRRDRTHPHFPNRTNVSFVKPVDEHTIDVRFFERGAGETMSSGTGSTGAVAAAVARGMVEQPGARADARRAARFAVAKMKSS